MNNDQFNDGIPLTLDSEIEGRTIKKIIEEDIAPQFFYLPIGLWRYELHKLINCGYPQAENLINNYFERLN